MTVALAQNCPELRETEHNFHMTAEETTHNETALAACIDESRVEDWYDSLSREVEFQCSLCDGLHMQIAELEDKVRQAYAATARSMRGLYDTKEIANRWLGMLYFASDALGDAAMARDTHQICGADLSGIQKYYDAALERFRAHCAQPEHCAAAA